MSLSCKELGSLCQDRLGAPSLHPAKQHLRLNVRFLAFVVDGLVFGVADAVFVVAVGHHESWPSGG